ncbi:hypothetical protein THAOC_07963 [Thalassiosira oceanica]|uniref:B30.2/SPRY domain-containing protein n=1 Tax=Thalassiosira oceanica TaxID=159749 RepID=K0SW64_THAOC|nr:hypothetical protein THAOC_07963 [Thalassiosira oceanica]|eukprot:EJK70658.1 hypothetical protein THAOC_07963 [Thalassiosira oceanica]
MDDEPGTLRRKPSNRETGALGRGGRRPQPSRGAREANTAEGTTKLSPVANKPAKEPFKKNPAKKKTSKTKRSLPASIAIDDDEDPNDKLSLIELFHEVNATMAERNDGVIERQQVAVVVDLSTAVARTRSVAERQKIAIVESALANVDVVRQLLVFLDAKDLCQVKVTCMALGSANDGAAFNGLSMVEEAAMQVYEGASDEEKAMLPRYNGESRIELYHHLLLLRGRLTFDQLVGSGVGYREGDKAAVRGLGWFMGGMYGQAICGNHIMRAGRHWATFTILPSFLCLQTFGVIRPLPGWDKRGLDEFSPANPAFRQDLLRERTDRWEGDVHYCRLDLDDGSCCWSDWTENTTSSYEGDEGETYWDWEGCDDYDPHKSNTLALGMLLDLGDGTLSLYQNGQRVGTLKDGLAGEYCWTAGCYGAIDTGTGFGYGNVSIRRGYNLGRVVGYENTA